MSKEYTAGIVMLILFAGRLFGVDLNQAGITEIVIGVVGAGAALIQLYNRFKRGDISVFGARKIGETK